MHPTPAMRSTTTAPSPSGLRGLVIAALVGALLLMTPVTTMAAPSPSPSAAPEETPAPVLQVTAPGDGAFIGRNSLAVAGTGTEPGASIAVTVAGGGVCSATVADDEAGELAWGCQIPRIDNGSSRVVTVTETAADGATNTASITVHVLGPPTIDAATPTTGIVAGTAHPGAKVTVGLSNSAGTCTTTATTTSYWSCTPTRAGGGLVPAGVYLVNARQSHGSIGGGALSTQTARTIEVDNVAPAPPVIVSPAGDYRLLTLPTTFSGTGEPGGSVDVYLDGVPVCSANIIDGTWSCIGGSTLSRAAHQVRALQVDRAGNFSAFSESIRVFFGPAPTTAGPQPSAPATPSPSPSPSPTRAPDASPTPPTPWPGPTGFPTLPSLSGDAGPDALTNWGTPTTFGAGLPGVQESVERGNWWRAPMLAIAAILLVALPLRLLASALRDRFPSRPAVIARRDHEPVPLRESHTAGANPWLAIAVPFAVTVAFMVIAGGVKGEVRYLRLTFAVALALAVLNLVGVAVAARFGHLVKGIDSRVRFTPLLLVAAIASGLLSRIIGLTPPFVTGTLVGIRMPHDTPVRGRAAVNLLQVATVLALGLAGWFMHDAIGEVVGFWPTLLSEIFATMCLISIGSVIVLMLPLASLPGRVVWEWHRWLWFVVAFAVGTIAFALLLGGASANFPLATMLIIAGAFAALCVAAWVTLRLLARRDA